MIKTAITLPTTLNQNLLTLAHTAARQSQPVLMSYSLPWLKTSLLDFLHHASNAPRVYWDSETASLGFAGYDVAATLTARGQDRFQDIQQQAAQLFEGMIRRQNDAPSQIGPRLFGGFSFRVEDAAQGFWAAFPAARFILPRVQLSRLKNETWLTLNHLFVQTDDPTEVAYSLHEDICRLFIALIRPEVASPAPTQPARTLPFADLMEASTWHNLVTDATRRIRRGDLDKVVLARARRMQHPQPVEPVPLLKRLKRSYPGCYRFLFEPVPGHAFYGATPELLAEVSGSQLRTVALAGSIKRGTTEERDRRLGRQLLNTPKEREEHAFVVETVKENLEPIVSRLMVDAEPGLLKLSNIQHLQTKITGRLQNDGGILPVVEALHPTPALGGRPRRIALDLINRSESIPRGWYGSPIGWIDQNHDGMFAVAIRSAVSVGAETMLYAGAGIVADSVPEKEWRETELKFKPLLDALAGSQ